MSDTVSVPLGVSFDVPIEALKGEKGDKGDPGRDGRDGVNGLPGKDGTSIRFEEGDFLPVIGGKDGESGQVYRYQQGSYQVIGKMCVVWFYIQFESTGTINGSLVLKNLPKRIAPGPRAQMYGSVLSYFSNPNWNRAPLMLTLQGGGGNTWADIQGIRVDLSQIQQGQNGSIFGGGKNPMIGSEMTAALVLNDHTQIIGSISYPTD